MRVEMSESYRKKCEAEESKRKREAEKKEKLRNETTVRCWPASPAWQPMESCPFAAMKYETVLVTDGDRVAVAKITERFGRPLRVVKPGEHVLRDGVLTIEGMETTEYDHPEWWFQWELEDALDDPSERFGRDEIDFVPTHFLTLPRGPLADPNWSSFRKR